jgi:riboflavin-specific deaminase-like protein
VLLELAARRRAASGAAAEGPAASATPVDAWVSADADGAWRRQPGVPAWAAVMLDLYLPVCAAPPRPGLPLTLAHLGQSLDGFIATGTGDSYYVTGPSNVRHMHRLRALCDAVIVGAGTVERDDPQLTTRHVPGLCGTRVVLDPRRRLDASCRVFSDGAAETLLVVGADGPAPSAGARFGQAEVIAVPAPHGMLDLRVLLERLRARGLTAVLVEGGGVTVSRFLEANLVDRLHVAIAPLITGAGRPGLSLPARERIADCLRPAYRVFRMGEDVLFDCALQDARAAHDEPADDLVRVL